MRKDQYKYPKSSFLGMQKDTALIIDKILNNKNVLKLLYYTSSDALSKPDLTSEQIKSLFKNKQITNIPKVTVDDNKLSYLVITYDSFQPNIGNNFYRDHIIEIKIICHYEDWDLEDFDLRPFRIAGEIDSMLQGQHLTGIGEIELIEANQDIYDDEYGGLTLRYLAVRGTEDKVNPLA